ncbi:HAD family hydrolase [Bacillus sp. sid0103]|uniref:HAD family hydrolase n=1 Tax=Bacillus sp. sid0103 TaxID=2856337 RepID=UPI001C4489A8|nr:HAD hydrolase family protein [Bacillus sp. sid0103]MBV7506456.1 HAD family hydrolase [Bacillus sp. sid0103]
MNVRAIFIDMDGTLLKASNNISRRNMEAIYRLINQGVKVFLATGRHYEVSVRTGTPSHELSALFKKEADIINWNDGFELVAPNVSKWSAIKSLLREFRISPNEVVAIGDGPNDIEMLRHVGTGVAMGNASEEVKLAADFVTEHHENDGLAEFIERYLHKSYESNVI